MKSYSSIKHHNLYCAILTNCTVISVQDRHMNRFKGSSTHFIFDINVGKGRIRHRTTLKWNDEFRARHKID